MGYELRMHVGEVPGIIYNKKDANKWKTHKGIRTGKLVKEGTKENPTYFMENSMVDLCKIDSDVCTQLNKLSATAPYVYFYPDGNTKTVEDSYGDPLKALPIKKVYDIINEAQATGHKYRRYSMALALLEQVIENFEHPVVMFYGH